jgi:hypothetical protein
LCASREELSSNRGVYEEPSLAITIDKLAPNSTTMGSCLVTEIRQRGQMRHKSRLSSEEKQRPIDRYKPHKWEVIVPESYFAILGRSKRSPPNGMQCEVISASPSCSLRRGEAEAARGLRIGLHSVPTRDEVRIILYSKIS